MQIKQHKTPNRAGDPHEANQLKTTKTPNKMKRSITYRGYIETTMTSDTSEDYRNLACAAAEAIIMLKSDFSYRSVTVSVDNRGIMTIEIERIESNAENPLKEGKLTCMESYKFLDEFNLSTAITALPFSMQDYLEDLTIIRNRPIS